MSDKWPRGDLEDTGVVRGSELRDPVGSMRAPEHAAESFGGSQSATSESHASRALHALTDDEILRERVRKHLSAFPPPPWWSGILRHPLTQVIIGFSLTWGVGTYLAGEWAQENAIARAKENRRQVKTEASLKAVQDISRIIEERRVRAALLLSALRRNRPLAEVQAKREAYEQAYIEWERHSHANLLTIRGATGATIQSPFEQLILAELNPSFERLDDMLTTAYDKRIRGVEVGDLNEEYGALRTTSACGFAITDQLFRLIADPTERDSLGIRLQPIESIQQKCRARPVSRPTAVFDS